MNNVDIWKTPDIIPKDDQLIYFYPIDENGNVKSDIHLSIGIYRKKTNDVKLIRNSSISFDYVGVWCSKIDFIKYIESQQQTIQEYRDLLNECRAEISILRENIGDSQYNGLNKEKSTLEIKLESVLNKGVK